MKIHVKQVSSRPLLRDDLWLPPQDYVIYPSVKGYLFTCLAPFDTFQPIRTRNTTGKPSWNLIDDPALLMVHMDAYPISTSSGVSCLNKEPFGINVSQRA